MSSGAIALVTVNEARLVRTACRLFGVERKNLFNRSRADHAAIAARQAIAWAMRKKGCTLARISQVIRRDHSTVVSAVRAVDAERKHRAVLLVTNRILRAA